MNTLLNLPPEQEAARQIEEARRRLVSEKEPTASDTLMRALLEVNLENRKRLTRIETRICKIAEMLSIDVK